MSASATLMTAGANPQLIATELETPPEPEPEPEPEPVAAEDAEVNGTSNESNQDAAENQPDPGTLEIEHTPDEEDHDGDEPEKESDLDTTMLPELKEVEQGPQILVDENGKLVSETEQWPTIGKVHGVGNEGQASDQMDATEQENGFGEHASGGQITANTKPEALDPDTDQLTMPSFQTPVLTHNRQVIEHDDHPEFDLENCKTNRQIQTKRQIHRQTSLLPTKFPRQ